MRFFRRLFHLFFAFEGRIGRKGFWFGFLVLFVVGLLANLPAKPFNALENPFDVVMESWERLGLYGFVVNAALLYPAAALLVKRLHDRNKPGWLALLFYVPAFLQQISFFIGWPDWLEKLYYLSHFIIAQFVAVSVWFFIELGFFRGTRGANRYGPDPRERT